MVQAGLRLGGAHSCWPASEPWAPDPKQQGGWASVMTPTPGVTHYTLHCPPFRKSLLRSSPLPAGHTQGEELGVQPALLGEEQAQVSSWPLCWVLGLGLRESRAQAQPSPGQTLGLESSKGLKLKDHLFTCYSISRLPRVAHTSPEGPRALSPSDQPRGTRKGLAGLGLQKAGGLNLCVPLYKWGN